MTRKCELCGKMFAPTKNQQIYCCQACATRAWNAAHKDRVRELNREAHARWRARRKLKKNPNPKTYAEIAAFNREHPLKEGWRR